VDDKAGKMWVRNRDEQAKNKKCKNGLSSLVVAFSLFTSEQ
jgi:hypothetical protein